MCTSSDCVWFGFAFLDLTDLVTTDVVDLAFPLSTVLSDFLVAAVTDVDGAVMTTSSMDDPVFGRSCSDSASIAMASLCAFLHLTISSSLASTVGLKASSCNWKGVGTFTVLVHNWPTSRACANKFGLMSSSFDRYTHSDLWHLIRPSLHLCRNIPLPLIIWHLTSCVDVGLDGVYQSCVHDDGEWMRSDYSSACRLEMRYHVRPFIGINKLGGLTCYVIFCTHIIFITRQIYFHSLSLFNSSSWSDSFFSMLLSESSILSIRQ